MAYITQICAFLFSAVLFVDGQAVKEVELPSNVKTCNHELPDYSSCLLQSIQDAWPTLVEGIPDLVPKLDPLEVEYLEDEIVFGSMKIRSVVRNVKVYGLAKTTFQAIRANRTADRMSIEVDFAIPKIFAEGHYKAENTIGSVKNSGKGYFNVTAEGTRATLSINGRIENDRWVLEHVRSSPDAIKVDNVKIYFDDLFNGNKELNKAALTFVNQYWRGMMYTLPSILYDQADRRWTKFLNELVFSKLSFAKTFP